MVSQCRQTVHDHWRHKPERPVAPAGRGAWGAVCEGHTGPDRRCFKAAPEGQAPRNIERILSPRPPSVSLSGGSGSSVSRASAVAVTSVKAEASSSGSVYPARRSPQPSQDVNDCKLAYQLPIPWQLELKLVNDLLGHEVVPHVPTDPPVQCFGHDIVSSKVHAAGCPNGRERCSSALPLAEEHCPACWCHRLRCGALYRGMGRHRTAVIHRVNTALAPQVMSPQSGCRGDGQPSCTLRSVFSLYRTTVAWRHRTRPSRPWPL
jgi:hypothetical protein